MAFSCYYPPMPAIARTRLDRFISRCENIHRKDVRLMLAQGRIQLDGMQAQSMNQVVGQFTRVTLDDRVLQSRTACYLMLNKPCGVVSATRDPLHRTVIDLVDASPDHALHIAGRLDFNSSGLMLLTNDGAWSRGLSDPDARVTKTYGVTVQRPLRQGDIDAFRAGMHFSYEDITTRPAELMILSAYEAQVTLIEGRYHQIKRMFGRLGNRVLSIHRNAIGELTLDPALASGESRPLQLDELQRLRVPHAG